MKHNWWNFVYIFTNLFLQLYNSIYQGLHTKLIEICFVSISIGTYGVGTYNITLYIPIGIKYIPTVPNCYSKYKKSLSGLGDKVKRH